MIWDGFDEPVKSQYYSEKELRDKYPALKLMYEQYQTLLKLCQEVKKS